MFKYLLTFQQVDDSFLNMVYAFGNHPRTPGICLASCSADRAGILSRDEMLRLPHRGLSGRELHISYLLQSVEPGAIGSMEFSKWSIRPTAVYHSFDVETGRSFWLTIKGSDLFHRRILDGRDSMTDWGSTSANSNEVPANLRSALATHLVYLAWCGEKWRSFIEENEEHITSVSERARTHYEALQEAAVHQELSGSTLRPIDRSYKIGTWNRIKKSLRCTWVPAVYKRTEELERGLIDSGGLKVISSEAKGPKEMALPNVDRELHSANRNIGRALLAIRQDLTTVEQVSDFYAKLGTGRSFPGPSAQEWEDIIEDFTSQTLSIMRELETRCAELECLAKEIDQELCQVSD